MIRVAIGQDSHRFEPDGSDKKLILGGVVIEGCPGLSGNSDADVVLHALTNAVSGITCVNILGEEADRMCRQGVTVLILRRPWDVWRRVPGFFMYSYPSRLRPRLSPY